MLHINLVVAYPHRISCLLSNLPSVMRVFRGGVVRPYELTVSWLSYLLTEALPKVPSPFVRQYEPGPGDSRKVAVLGRGS